MSYARRISAGQSTVRVAGRVALGVVFAIVVSVTIASAAGHHRADRAAKSQDRAVVQFTRMLSNSAKSPGAAIAEALAARGIDVAKATKSARGGRGARRRGLRTSTFSAAIDWPYAYSAVFKRAISFRDPFSVSSPSNPLTLVRRNLVTGEQATLLKLRRAVPMVIRADAGRVAVSLIDVTSTSGGERVASRIVEFDAGATTPRVLALDNLSSVDDDLLGNRICGRVSVLTGIADTGEALVTRLTGNCTTDGQSSYLVETLALAADGSSRILDTRSRLEDLIYSRMTLTGDRLMRYSPLASSVSRLNTTTGEDARVWRGSDTTFAISQASDGSIAISGGRADDYSYYDETAPLVIFPQGDVDQPNVVADLSSTSMATQYCGEKLYELQLARRNSRYGPGFDYLGFSLAFSNGGLPGNTRLKVIVRDINGGAPRRLAVTRKQWVRAIGCDGETLLLATAPRRNVHVARYGP